MRQAATSLRTGKTGEGMMSWAMQASERSAKALEFSVRPLTNLSPIRLNVPAGGETRVLHEHFWDADGSQKLKVLIPDVHYTFFWVSKA